MDNDGYFKEINLLILECENKRYNRIRKESSINSRYLIHLEYCFSQNENERFKKEFFFIEKLENKYKKKSFFHGWKSHWIFAYFFI